MKYFKFKGDQRASILIGNSAITKIKLDSTMNRKKPILTNNRRKNLLYKTIAGGRKAK